MNGHLKTKTDQKLMEKSIRNGNSIQCHAFTAWLSWYMNEPLTFDQINGAHIIRLLEKLSGRTCSFPVPKRLALRYHQIEAANASLRFAQSLNVPITSIEPSNIVDHDVTFLLAFIASIVTFYLRLNKAGLHQPLEWLKATTQLRISNYTSDWRDGFVLQVLFVTETPFDLFPGFDIPLLITQDECGFDALSTMLLVHLLYQRRDRIDAYRRSLPDLNERCPEIIERRQCLQANDRMLFPSEWVRRECDAQREPAEEEPVAPESGFNVILAAHVPRQDRVQRAGVAPSAGLRPPIF